MQLQYICGYAFMRIHQRIHTHLFQASLCQSRTLQVFYGPDFGCHFEPLFSFYWRKTCIRQLTNYLLVFTQIYLCSCTYTDIIPDITSVTETNDNDNNKIHRLIKCKIQCNRGTDSRNKQQKIKQTMKKLNNRSGN